MPELYGNTTGLSPSATKTLERIYRRRVPLQQVATPELIRSLAEASQQAGRQVGALVHRSGQVDYVVVGDATKLVLPDIGRLRAAEGRFRGLRLVHTHLHGEPLTRDDIVDLVRLRLDLVAALQLAPDGALRSVVYAHNVPRATGTRGSADAAGEDSDLGDQGPTSSGGGSYREIGPLQASELSAVDFGKLITALEEEYARVARSRPAVAKDGRAILVYVAEKRERGRAQADDVKERVAELRELSRTAGVAVADVVVQLREKLDPKFVMGKGKLDDVVLRAVELDAQTLIFDRNLSPAQASAIAKHTDLKIIDRTQLILDIFAQRAQSSDGKLQVELAQLKYSLPRLSMKDDSLSRLTGGIGGRGPGETKLEIGRRRAKERVSHLEAQLKKLSKQREQRRRRRGRLDVPIVSIVGYTNAGKSTLLNTLTDSQVLAENRLFATLDTRSRRLRFPEEREVIVTDTVGFIRDLPEDLFAAFRATFEETADADLLLHVVDASDPAHDKHIETTEKLLGELALDTIPRIIVFNKADRVAPIEGHALLLQHPSSLLVSATHRETTRALLDRIADELREKWESSRLGPARDALRLGSEETETEAAFDGESPSSTADGDGAAKAEAPTSDGEDGDALTTLDQMLGTGRPRRSRPEPRA